MKEEQKIYIRGSKDRPDDVRRILEQYGGRVKGIIIFTLNGFYFINHKGIIDYTPEGSELSQMIIEYYNEITLPNLEHWETGDILVSDDNIDRFFIFDKLYKDGNMHIYLEVIKGYAEYGFPKINTKYHLIPNTPCHKADDVELKTFYNILAENDLTWDAYNKVLIRGNYMYFYPKNNHFYFKKSTLRCKDKTTGEWYDGVLYSDANSQYVREANDFNKKFKKIC